MSEASTRFDDLNGLLIHIPYFYVFDVDSARDEGC